VYQVISEAVLFCHSRASSLPAEEKPMTGKAIRDLDNLSVEKSKK
jgi:hypothetical protein